MITSGRSRPTLPGTALVAGVALVLGLAACSPDESDFSDEAENLIGDSDELNEQTQTTFDDVECEEPADTDVGTKYQCTAVDAEGRTWDFDVEITGEDEFNVVNGAPRE